MSLVTFVWSWQSRMSSNIGGWKHGGRLITLIDFPPEPLLDVSASRPLTEMWVHVCVDSAECDCEFSFSEEDNRPSPESVEHDACVRRRVVSQHWHKCYNTLLCKCQSHPIKCLSDAIALKGFPPIKFCVCYRLCFLFFLSFPETLHSQECCARTPLQYIQWQLIQYHVSCCSSLALFSVILLGHVCLLFICEQFWPPTRWLYLQRCQSVVCSVDFTLITGCSTRSQAPTLFCSVAAMKFILAVQKQPTVTDFSRRCLMIDQWTLHTHLSYFPILFLCSALSVSEVFCCLGDWAKN